MSEAQHTWLVRVLDIDPALFSAPAGTTAGSGRGSTGAEPRAASSETNAPAMLAGQAAPPDAAALKPHATLSYADKEDTQELERIAKIVDKLTLGLRTAASERGEAERTLGLVQHLLEGALDDAVAAMRKEPSPEMEEILSELATMQAAIPDLMKGKKVDVRFASAPRGGKVATALQSVRSAWEQAARFVSRDADKWETQRLKEQDQTKLQLINQLYEMAGRKVGAMPPGLTRIAESLLTALHDPTQPASMSGLTTIQRSGIAQTEFDWDDVAEEKRLSDAASTARQAAFEGQSPDEIESDRQDMMANLEDMSAGTLQDIIAAGRDFTTGMEDRFVSPDKRAAERTWCEAYLKRAETLLPHAKPEEQGPDEAAQAVMVADALADACAQQVEAAEAFAAQTARNRSLPYHDFMREMELIMTKMKGYQDKYLILDSIRSKSIADLKAGAKRVVGGIRAALAAGLKPEQQGVTWSEADLAAAISGLNEAEVIFAIMVSTLSGDPAPRRSDPLSDTYHDHHAALDAMLLDEAKRTVDGANALHSRDEVDSAAYINLVEDGRLSAVHRNKLLEELRVIQSNNPTFERIRQTVQTALNGAISEIAVSPDILELIPA